MVSAAERLGVVGAGLPGWAVALGMALVYVGVVCATASPGALVLLPVVIIVMEFGVIRREERYLERRFGEAYRAYKSRVRRWL
jgi:protein-S-isoprenylcysteine O-methyltransferase Ste14